MFGYIDAATGGMIVAAAAGGLAGLRVAVKSLVPGRRRKAVDSPAEGQAQEPETTPPNPL